MTDASWLEEIWEEREERIYPAMFGPLRGIFTIPAWRFARFEAPPDPRWLTVGVFECAPTPARSTWLYVTSGLSNPWDGEKDPSEPSGYGCEFAVETNVQAEWPIKVLHHLASIQLLSMSKRIESEPLGRGDRIGMGGAIDNASSALRHVLLTEPTTFPATLQQRSGTAEWLFCVGLTDDEKAFAREHGNDELLSRLRAAGAFPITDASRATVRL